MLYYQWLFNGIKYVGFLQVALSRRSAKTSPPPPIVSVEISQYGIRMLDKSKLGVRHYIVSLMSVKREFRLIFLVNFYVRVSQYRKCLVFWTICIFFFSMKQTTILLISLLWRIFRSVAFIPVMRGKFMANKIKTRKLKKMQYVEHFFVVVGISDSLLNTPSRIGLHVMYF